MFSRIETFYLSGLRSEQIDVEVDISRGIPDFKIIGLCGTGIHESAKRIRAAFINSGFSFPKGRVTVNLAPADMKKDGSGFDLPIAVGIMVACGMIPAEKLKNVALIGELSLDGTVKAVKGVLPMISRVENFQGKQFIVPCENLCELHGIGALVCGVSNLKDAVKFLCGDDNCFKSSDVFADVNDNSGEEYDFADVSGQQDVKRAIEIAVSGRHNILFMGSRGCGKTMLAKCIPGLMPEMSRDEALTTASIYSAAGLFLKGDRYLSQRRPFREVHPNISQTALTGKSDNGIGEINLAHNGVLYIDEITEMKPALIDSLRLPLENKYSLYTKNGIAEKIPADFLLVATANPCKCGNLFEGADKCMCSRVQIRNRLSKISLPVADRIDIQIPVRSVKFSEYEVRTGESSETVRKRIERTMDIQTQRYKNMELKQNGRVGRHMIERYCKTKADAKSLIENAVNDLGFSIRGIEKVLRVARTIADMECREEISKYDVAEALGYRMLDRREFC